MPDKSTIGPRRDPAGPIFNGPAQDSAALLLVESLIHGLIARSHLTALEAIEIIDTAAEVEREIHDARPGPTTKFRSLLAPLSRSLRLDLAG